MTQEETTTTATEEALPERKLPCIVRHPDAGGRCERRATFTLYRVLNFCEEHGEEAKTGMLLEEHQDATYFFERFRSPSVPKLQGLIDWHLHATVRRLGVEGPNDGDHHRALSRAYPAHSCPERVHEMIRGWERDEELNAGPHPLDLLLDSYYTICKLMRLAHEDGEDWLVELLEYERQGQAAQAAVALRSVALGIRPG